MLHSRSTYKINNWNETMLTQYSAEQKMSKVYTEFFLSGALEGKATVEYLIYYTHADAQDEHQSNSAYVSLIYFSGKANNLPGSFALEDRGTFTKGAASSSLRIIEGSGTEKLLKIRGTGNYRANNEGNFFDLDYDL